jgi:Tol biopolymer transport system component
VLVYTPTLLTKLVEVDRSGKREALATEDRRWHHPRYSRDGTRIVVDFVDDARERDVWLLDRSAQSISRVTRIGDAHDPSWLPNGHDVSFFTFKSGSGPLMVVPADRTSAPQPVRVARGFAPADLVDPGGWLPDGSAYIGSVRDHGAPADVWRIPRDGSDPLKIVGTSYDEIAPSVSRDGGLLLYQSDETGSMEVYLRRLDREQERVQVSRSGGTAPVWDPKGSIVYYVEAAGSRRRLVAVTLRTSGSLGVVDRTIVIPDLRLDESDNHPNYDVHPGGDRFVIPELQETPGLVAVFDWAKSAQPK